MSYIENSLLRNQVLCSGHMVFFSIINHRAKRGGSLFQGGSGREEGREATPHGDAAPLARLQSDPGDAGGLASVRQFS